jgi:hypothetical protein
MKLISFILILIGINNVLSAAVQENNNNNNKFYIISIKDSNEYSFNIEFNKPKETRLEKKAFQRRRRFTPLHFNDVKNIIKSKHCLNEIKEKNINDTSLCNFQKDGTILKNGKLNFVQLEKKLKPKPKFVKKQMNKFAELILDHIDTYQKDDAITEEVQSLMRKRSEMSYEDISNNEAFSKILTEAFSVLDVTVIYAYLSEELYNIIKDLPDVVSCNEDVVIPFPNDTIISINDTNTFEIKSDKKFEKRASYYDLYDIKRDTNWSDVTVFENTYHHLSLISQSKYDRNLVGKYDRNFYYPISAGRGVDIYILDSGIYGDHIDFDTGHRTVSCDAMFGKTRVINQPGSSNYKNCYLENELKFHGSMVASVAAGKYFGVAKNANIHMIVHDRTALNILYAYDYVKKYAKNPHKTVINLSFGNYIRIPEEEKMINSLAEMGFIVIAAAGNDYTNACTNNPRQVKQEGQTVTVTSKMYPAAYSNVIAVGATNNDIQSLDVTNVSNLYNVASFSNYGNCLDIFGPGYVYGAYPGYDYRNNNSIQAYAGGTSFSCPIVAGVAASIISEHPEIEFNVTILRQWLLDNAVRNIIGNSSQFDSPDIFLNNGKKTVYSANDQYNGCGILSGKRTCPGDNCCSASTGYCGRNFCDIDCQSEFGYCNNKNNNSYDDNQKNCWSSNLGYSCCPSGTPVYFTDENGDWGIINDDWCGIVDNSSGYCFSEELGYPCCSGGVLVYEKDEHGSWGIENNDWCGIIGSESKKQDCFSIPLGYPCCSEGTPEYYTDENGSWGVENDDWCGI